MDILKEYFAKLNPKSDKTDFYYQVMIQGYVIFLEFGIASTEKSITKIRIEPDCATRYKVTFDINSPKFKHQYSGILTTCGQVIEVIEKMINDIK